MAGPLQLDTDALLSATTSAEEAELESAQSEAGEKTLTPPWAEESDSSSDNDDDDDEDEDSIEKELDGDDDDDSAKSGSHDDAVTKALLSGADEEAALSTKEETEDDSSDSSDNDNDDDDDDDDDDNDDDDDDDDATTVKDSLMNTEVNADTPSIAGKSLADAAADAFLDAAATDQSEAMVRRRHSPGFERKVRSEARLQIHYFLRWFKKQYLIPYQKFESAHRDLQDAKKATNVLKANANAEESQGIIKGPKPKWPKHRPMTPKPLPKKRGKTSKKKAMKKGSKPKPRAAVGSIADIKGSPVVQDERRRYLVHSDPETVLESKRLTGRGRPPAENDNPGHIVSSLSTTARVPNYDPEAKNTKRSSGKKARRARRKATKKLKKRMAGPPDSAPQSFLAVESDVGTHDDPLSVTARTRLTQGDGSVPASLQVPSANLIKDEAGADESEGPNLIPDHAAVDDSFLQLQAEASAHSKESNLGDVNPELAMTEDEQPANSELTRAYNDAEAAKSMASPDTIITGIEDEADVTNSQSHSLTGDLESADDDSPDAGIADGAPGKPSQFAPTMFNTKADDLPDEAQ